MAALALYDQLSDLGITNEDEAKFIASIKDADQSTQDDPLGKEGLILTIAQKLVYQIRSLDDDDDESMEVNTDGLNGETIKSFLQDRSYPYALTGSSAALDILTFLAAELQACRIMVAAQLTTATGKGHTNELSTVNRLLIKALKSLESQDIVTTNQNPQVLLSLVEEAIDKRLTELPSNYLTEDQLLVPEIELNQGQRDILNDINTALRHDFTLRRRMLLKRLDVTLQSFLWAEKAQGIEADIVAAVNSKREGLSETPQKIEIEDVLSTSRSVMYQQAAKITQDRGAGLGRHLVKSIIIGAVPDRGGRANEMRVNKSSYHQGGGRGRGRGGGGRNNNRNKNNNNNKNRR